MDHEFLVLDVGGYEGAAYILTCADCGEEVAEIGSYTYLGALNNAAELHECNPEN